MPETVILCRTDELSSGQARRFDVAGHRIALVRTEGRVLRHRRSVQP
jgi:nitrite reductase/ring-hydroxylating ferredoxin subunit